MKSKFSAILLEIIPVAIGVFLGFLVSNWADNRTNYQKTQNLKENITAEVISNKHRIEKVIDYHKTLRDSSVYYANNRITREPRFFQGINTAFLLKSAFETGIQTGLINGFPIDLIQEANDVYNIQNEYSDFKSLLLSSILSIDVMGEEKEKRRFFTILALAMTDVVIHEEMLLEKYETLLEKLED